MLLFLVWYLRIFTACWDSVVIIIIVVKIVIVVIIYILLLLLILLLIFLLSLFFKMHWLSSSRPLKSQASPRCLFNGRWTFLRIRVKLLHSQFVNEIIWEPLHWLVYFCLNFIEIYLSALDPVLFLLLLSEVVVHLLEGFKNYKPSFGIKNTPQTMRNVK